MGNLIGRHFIAERQVNIRYILEANPIDGTVDYLAFNAVIVEVIQSFVYG